MLYYSPCNGQLLFTQPPSFQTGSLQSKRMKERNALNDITSQLQHVVSANSNSSIHNKKRARNEIEAKQLESPAKRRECRELEKFDQKRHLTLFESKDVNMDHELESVPPMPTLSSPEVDKECLKDSIRSLQRDISYLQNIVELQKAGIVDLVQESMLDNADLDLIQKMADHIRSLRRDISDRQITLELRKLELEEHFVEIDIDTNQSAPVESDSAKEIAALPESEESDSAEVIAAHPESEESDSAKEFAAHPESEESDSAEVIAALHTKIAKLEAEICALELLNTEDSEEEEENDSSEDSKKLEMILLLKYLNTLFENRIGSEYKDMSEEEKRALGTVAISEDIEIAKPIYDEWIENIPVNEVTTFIMNNPKCVAEVNTLFYKDNVFAMPYMGKIGNHFNVLFMGTFNLKVGSTTYEVISDFIKPFSEFISSKRPPSASEKRPFDVGFIIPNLCNSLLPSQVVTDLERVFRYMKKCPRDVEGNELIHQLNDALLARLETMNQDSELVHEKLLKVLLEEIKGNNCSKIAVNCAYEFFSEKVDGIFNDSSSIYNAVEKGQGGSIPVVKTNHLCSGNLGSGNKSKDSMEQARDTVTMMMQLGMNIDHHREYTTDEVKSILEEKNEAGISWLKTFLSMLKFERETTELYKATVKQRKLENKQRKEMLRIVTSNGGGGPVSKKVYYGTAINDVEDGQDFPNKSIQDFVPFLRNKFPKQFKGKSDRQIRNRIFDAIRKKGQIGRDGLFVSYNNDDLVEILEKKVKLVYYGNAIYDVEAGQDFPNKSIQDFVTLLRNKFTKRFKGMSDQQIRNRISEAIRKGDKVCKDGPFVSYNNDDLVEILGKKVKLVYYGNAINDVEAGQDFPNKSIEDFVPFLRNKFPKQFKGKSDRQIRKVISNAIGACRQVCSDGPFVSYNNNGLVEVLEAFTKKQTKKKGKTKATTKKQTKKKGKTKATTGKTTTKNTTP